MNDGIYNDAYRQACTNCTTLSATGVGNLEALFAQDRIGQPERIKVSPEVNRAL